MYKKNTELAFDVVGIAHHGQIFHIHRQKLKSQCLFLTSN